MSASEVLGSSRGVASYYFCDECQFGLEADLTKHVVHDDDTLWDRFLAPFSSNPSDSLPYEDRDLVRKVVATLRTDSLSALNEIEAVQAMRYRQEKRMMKPLETLFRTIEEETAKHCENREYFRAFVRTDESTLDVPLVNDSPFRSHTVVKPDFVLIDLPRPSNDLGMLTDPSNRTKPHIDWRHCSAFVEVKAKSEDLPSPTPDIEEDFDNLTFSHQTLTECVDHAGHLVTSRPSRLSTYALFICGNAFCIALCDRGSGIVLSPAKRLSPAADAQAVADLECFVRVVLRFTWEMSPCELGEDPTVRLAAGHTSYQENFPHYDVGMGCGPEFEATTRWTTVEGPLWASHSLLGSGTSVWPALDRQKTPLVLKISWRAVEPGRRSETEIHDTVRSFLRDASVEVPKGLALAFVGGDVYDDSGKAMSVSNRRGLPEDKYEPRVDRVLLYRMCFRRFGKPIWRYLSLEEFARAMRDVVQAHNVLSSYGILHGNVSAGNILIDVDASYKAATATEPEGIALKDRDPQNASGYSVGQADPRPVEPDSSPLMKVASGDMTTGTPLFFATEVLLGLKAKRRVVHDKMHDIESFEWVILFAVYRHSIESARKGFYGQAAKEWEPMLTKEFRHIFPSVGTPSALTGSRVVALGFPGFNDADYFEEIRRLLSFVEHVVGSQALLHFLMDIWEDLTYRFQALVYRTKGPPVRPESLLRDDNRLVVAVAIKRHPGHEDLIRGLENLLPYA